MNHHPQYIVLCTVCEMRPLFSDLRSALEFKEDHDKMVSYPVKGSITALHHTGVVIPTIPGTS